MKFRATFRYKRNSPPKPYRVTRRLTPQFQFVAQVRVREVEIRGMEGHTGAGTGIR